jgi:hypothetical protein
LQHPLNESNGKIPLKFSSSKIIAAVFYCCLCDVLNKIELKPIFLFY